MQKSRSSDITKNLLDSVREVMLQLGFTISPSSSVRGLSGVEHKFALIAESKDGKRIVFDILDDSKPYEISILALYTKAYDVNAFKCIAIANEEPEEEVRKLAGLYSIHIMNSSKGTEEIKRHIYELISS